jgi:hypothetical protein
MMITLPVGSTARVVKADSRPAVREDLIEPRSAARTSGCPTPVQQPGSDAADSALLSSWTASYAQVVLPRLGELGAFNPRVRGSIPRRPTDQQKQTLECQIGVPCTRGFCKILSLRAVAGRTGVRQWPPQFQREWIEQAVLAGDTWLAVDGRRLLRGGRISPPRRRSGERASQRACRAGTCRHRQPVRTRASVARRNRTRREQIAGRIMSP